MNKYLLAALIGLAGSAQAAQNSTLDAAEPDWFDRYVVRRLEVGTRLTHVDILDEHHSNGDEFLNHIIKLDERQDSVPNRIFVDYWVTRSFGLEIASAGLEADLVNEGLEHSSDGAVELDGPCLLALGRLDSLGAFTPYGGVGIAFLHASIHHDPWHRYGFESERDWVEAGRPEEPRHGKSRHFKVDDDWGFAAVAGVDIHLARGWSIDVQARYLDVSIYTAYSTTIKDDVVQEDARDIPFDHLAYSFGLRYAF